MRKIRTTIKWRNLIIFLIAAVGLLILAQRFIRPNMVGWHIDRVKIYENGNDLRIHYSYDFSDFWDYGIVMEQDSCERDSDCDISLLISKGRDVSRLPESEILFYLEQLVEENLIRENQIYINEPVFSDDVEAGYALIYIPAPSEGRIEITFSRGPQIFVERARFLAAGDLLFSEEWMAGEENSLSALLEPFSDIFQKSDFSLVRDPYNLAGYLRQEEEGDEVDGETGVDYGEAEEDSLPPWENTLAADVGAAGFNLISRSSRSAYIYGLEALERASEEWDSIFGVITAGVGLEESARQEIPILKKHGISVAFLSYTLDLSYPIPPNSDYLINRFSFGLAEKQIQLARELADVIVVSIDWYEEGAERATYSQMEKAQWLADQGVNIVLGAQRGSVFPVSTLRGQDGNETLVAYSLGTLASDHSQMGAVIGFNIRMVTMRGETTIHFDQVEIMPLWIEAADDEGILLVPLEEAGSEAPFTLESFLEMIGDEAKVVQKLYEAGGI